MNIKQHIEAGHYERDESGVSKVPTRCGNMAFIYSTKHHPEWPIVGGIEGEVSPYCWRADGGVAGPNNPHAGSRNDLLPPQPRKVEVKRWISLLPNGCLRGMFSDEQTAQLSAENCGGFVVELTGSYEQEW